MTDKKPCSPEPSYCFTFGEQQFKVAHAIVTAATIKEVVGDLAGNDPIVQILKDGTQKQLSECDEVKLADCSQFKKLPHFVRGFDRVDAELQLLRTCYPKAERTATGVVIPDYPMPAAFAQEHVNVVIPVPPPYPSAPPDNFFVTWGLALRSGQTIQAYTGPVAIDGSQWGQFSHHIKGGWNPSPDDPTRGDNLLTYLVTIQSRLEQGA